MSLTKELFFLQEAFEVINSGRHFTNILNSNKRENQQK